MLGVYIDDHGRYVAHISIMIDMWNIYRWSWSMLGLYISMITVDNWHIYRLWLICGIYIGDQVDAWRIYRWSRSICGTHIDCDWYVEYLSVITVDAWRIYQWSRSICGTYIDCHCRYVTHIYIYIYIGIHGWYLVINPVFRYFSLSDKMSHLDVTSSTLSNFNKTTNVTPTVVAQRRYRGVFIVEMSYGFTA